MTALMQADWLPHMSFISEKTLKNYSLCSSWFLLNFISSVLLELSSALHRCSSPLRVAVFAYLVGLWTVYRIGRVNGFDMGGIQIIRLRYFFVLQFFGIFRGTQEAKVHDAVRLWTCCSNIGSLRYVDQGSRQTSSQDVRRLIWYDFQKTFWQ